MDKQIQPVTRLTGEVSVPGDKSISHRAVMFGALADGVTRVTGFLPGADCLSTVDCFRKLGVQIEQHSPTELSVHGVGLDGLQEPTDVLDVGNSGTTARLMLGILAGQSFHCTVTGDASIRKRPMGRVAGPLREMGARIEGRDGGRLAPLSVRGGGLQAFRYDSPVASAQVKSGILLAGLFAEGATGVREPEPSRDHTERMLQAFGVVVEDREGYITVQGGSRLTATDIEVPGDISSAAFLLVAAAIVPGSDVTIRGVGLNPTRTGILDVLLDMGAQIEVVNERQAGGEPVADLRVRGSRLRATTVRGAIIPRLIDEVPVLAVAATQAEGVTEIRDAAELKVKESNRIATTANELRKFGAIVEELEDGLRIHGGAQLQGGAVIETHHDHRIAMSMAVAALVANGATTIRDWESVDVSFPGFAELFQNL
ncbi:3-phosphoshikimate 1-carboxyvinyltransferase [Tumebacillus permanentifrigoris]|uniref:3-phosphoshikimate 1-carboxyvinyltransferase n=1 Tax=Tumebacillus permanentifrigoris TaxID=378543 RepID=A0A316D475_9BACL|nr:3-phosphoshikimate 1-carboxyvinyltransferase [Tumebacillus permanentifrigoris]PWK06609.1 3-phosphoshikimate 1-carboxyvinyltransferase [Tumebacillus permanentifrigoris]